MNDTHPAKIGRSPTAALAAITQAVTSSLDVARIFGVMVEQAGEIVAHDAMLVLLHATPHDAAASQLTLAFCHPPSLEPGRSWPVSDFSFGSPLLANQAAVVNDLGATASGNGGDRDLRDKVGRAALIVPVPLAARVLGALVLVSRDPGLYDSPDALLIEPVAGLLALALEHQRLDQQASALAVVEERNRLAREIHDTLAQSLTGIIINLESLKPYSAGRSPAEADVLADTELLARGALEEARRSVLGLQPTPLQHQSLREALAPELAGLAKRAGIATQFYVHGLERPLPPDVATALFRVAQEAFQNIYKHAAARHAMVGLAFEDEAVVLTVEDDGAGFVPNEGVPGESGGFGLLSMAARARSLGGELLLTSRPAHGTAVRATIPYGRAGAAAPAAPVDRDQMGTPPPATSPIRVLIVDDQPLARQGIRRILEAQPDMHVVGEAEDGLVAVEQARQLRPDVVLLDLQLPGLAGIEVLRRIRSAQPEIEVVIFTMFDQDEQVFASLKAGARGYVLKDAAPATITAAIRAASQGQAALPPTLATRVIDQFAVLARRDVNPDELSEREMEVLRCMAKGMPSKEIAAELNITAKTVQYHVTNILRKLGAGNRGEAVAAASAQGLLDRAR